MVVKLVKNEVRTDIPSPTNHFEAGVPTFGGTPNFSYMQYPNRIYDSIVREDNINPCCSMYGLINGSAYENIGDINNSGWSSVIDSAILASTINPFTQSYWW
jgi:hypothetical protein